MLYRATQNPFYLRVGFDILQSLNTFARVKCGYATVHNVVDKSLEDRMESFFLSETVKYLYLVSLFCNLDCIKLDGFFIALFVVEFFQNLLCIFEKKIFVKF